MNKEKVLSILKDLHTISGFRISLYNTNREEIAAYPEKKLEYCSYLHNCNRHEFDRCKSCDRRAFEMALQSKEPMIYKCHNGLTEAICPIYNFGALTGFVLMGQIKIEGEAIDALLYTLASVGKTGPEARKLCERIPSVKRDLISSYVNIASICASQLTLSFALSGAKTTVAELAMRYINENYTERISIKDICREIGYSKSTVLSSFKKEFSTTINAYLTNMRLERAKKMLESEELTINEIALSCGFSDQSYFSKVFSAKYKITPSDYRRDEKK